MTLGIPGSTNKTPRPTLAMGANVMVGPETGRIVLVRRRKWAKRYGVALERGILLCRRDQLRLA